MNSKATNMHGNTITSMKTKENKRKGKHRKENNTQDNTIKYKKRK